VSLEVSLFTILFAVATCVHGEPNLLFVVSTHYRIVAENSVKCLPTDDLFCIQTLVYIIQFPAEAPPHPRRSDPAGEAYDTP